MERRLQLGAVVADRFEIGALAGTGGMATVYRACDRESGETVALKILDEGGGDEASRFAREARVLSGLRHPGIVRYVAHGEMPEGRAYLAMEWLDGETLRARLSRERLPLNDGVELVRALAAALVVAHDRGVVHRDLKPSNVFLPSSDVRAAKLLDFGIAHLSGATRVVTRTGMMIGTPGYMAPEQARGDPAIDARTDVFALGALLFECLAGRAAFVGEHPMAQLAKILFDDAPPLAALCPEAPPEVEALLRHLMAKRREERPIDARAVLAALEPLGPFAAPARGLARPPAITLGEQRLLCVVLAAPESRDSALEAGEDRTARLRLPGRGGNSDGRDRAIVDALRAAAAPFGGGLERLVDGSVAWSLSGGGVATDQACQGARCALALRRVLPTAPIALATGRGLYDRHGSMGEVIDRAAQLLSMSVVEEQLDPPVRLDDTTAGLLDARFEVRADGRGLALAGLREQVVATRTLLGRPTPCVGRDRELASLQATFAECVEESAARVVLVTGAPGVGKSRLRYELLQRLAQKGERLEVWLARADVMKAGSPFALLGAALRRAAGILDSEPLGRRKKLRARVGRHLPGDDITRVSAFLGELAGVQFPDEALPALRAARAEPPLMADQVRRAFEEFLAAECADHPVLLVLDDLHWGDLPTVRLLDGALRNLAGRPFMVLAMARPEVHDLFPDLWRERHVEELRLRPLTPRASERLAREVLGDGVGASTLARLVEVAEGNAFFLEELIRAVHEGNATSLPATVLAMAQARLERVEPEARRLLRAASVFGEVFWRAGVSELLGGEVARIGEWLAVLTERELIQRRPESQFGAEPEYVFRHGLLREAAYSTLTGDDRQLGHRLAGAWLEQMGEGDAMALGAHYERGGEAARAAVHYRRGAQHALEGNDLTAALARAAQGLACDAAGALRGPLHLLQAEAYQWRGEYADAERCSVEAVAGLERGSPGWFTAVALSAEASSKTGNVARLEELGAALLALDGDAVDGAGAGACAIAMARCASQLLLHGKLAVATSLIARTEPLRERFADAPDVLSAVLDASAVLALYTGNLGGYLTHKEQVVRACAAAGQQRTEILQRVRLGYACLEIGAYPRAVTELRDALAAAKRLGLHQATALAHHNLGMALARVGQLDEARRLETAAIDAFRAQGDRRLERASRVYLAEILLLGDSLDEAAAELQALVADAHDGSPTSALAQASLAHTQVRQGRFADALVSSTAAMALLEQLGGMDEGEAMVRLAHVEALLGMQQQDQALRTLRAARTRLDERAARIVDPELRRVFLEQVPENVRTRALATQLLES